MLTAEQRYNQAIRKARIMTQRAVRKMMAGEADETPSMMDLERKFLIAEIERAYRIGQAVGSEWADRMQHVAAFRDAIQQASRDRSRPCGSF